MDVIYWLLVILVLAVWVVTLMDIFRKWGDRPTGKSVLWLVVVLLFPLLGTIVYFLVNDVFAARREESI